jgi:hypothetical protein
MKKWTVKLVLFSAIIAASIVYLHGFWVANDPYSPFSQKTSSEIGNMITDSASELMQSASEVFLFMHEVEIAEQNGLNCGAALQRVDLAAEKAEKALKIFNEIITVGSEAGYDKGYIRKLKAFNYEQYARENGLSSETMAKVSVYLGNGNLLGFYRRHASNLETLLNILDHVKKDLLAGKLLENQVLWSLLQQYNSTMTLGNYASLVFYRI